MKDARFSYKCTVNKRITDVMKWNPGSREVKKEPGSNYFQLQPSHLLIMLKIKSSLTP